MVTRSKSVDRSAKIGGRIVEPYVKIVEVQDPTPLDRSFQETLDAYSKENLPLESEEGIRRRERALISIGDMVREWIRSVCTKKGYPQAVVDQAGGQLFTSGSFRLGVHEPGADIDVVVVAPNMCTREDYFGAILEEREDRHHVRDPDSLAERILAHPDVSEFKRVESAATPILTFDWEDVNIDLLFATLNAASVPANLDINYDAVLDGVDGPTEKSLNGPRATNLIAALVSGTEERRQNFLATVRCIRKWAKVRGLYSNKLGYWGGININMAVALMIQLYPLANSATLIRKFFLVYSKGWTWPNPMMLTKPYDAGYGLPVWSQQNDNRSVAPMITPAYPAMNSTISMSRQTLQIMQEEFDRGCNIMERLWREHQSNPDDPVNWKELFEPSDFFISYPDYISICIVGGSKEETDDWSGWVESRLRRLVSDNLGRSLPLSKIQLWPKPFPKCVADKGVMLTKEQRQFSKTYFLGLKVDTLRMRGNELNVESQIMHFRKTLTLNQTLLAEMDILFKPFKCKMLPKFVFEDMYEGGKEEAMRKRRKLRDADPVRQRKKEAARLMELKAKMARLQQKQAEKDKDTVEGPEEEEGEPSDRKRKREDDSSGDERESKTVKIEQEVENVPDESDGAAGEPQLSEEAALLEHALDAMQEDAAMMTKTREEAEADRRRLLAGELLVEGDEVDEDEEAEYIGDARQILLPTAKAKADNAKRDIRSLPLGEDETEILRKVGWSVVSDEDAEILGGNMILPWRRPEVVEGRVDGKKPLTSAKINFRTKFDIVELDANGHIIDKGDEDFTPSSKWAGRKAGFEFKLGERGLGYYRTGKKVVVPSNTAY